MALVTDAADAGADAIDCAALAVGGWGPTLELVTIVVTSDDEQAEVARIRLLATLLIVRPITGSRIRVPYTRQRGTAAMSNRNFQARFRRPRK